MAYSYTRFTAMKFNWKTSTDTGNPLERYPCHNPFKVLNQQL